MNLKDAILKRRSIRKYKDKAVPNLLIKELLEVARMAPSAYNSQPSRFFIIKDKKIKKILRENNVFKQDFVYLAPVIIVCSADKDVFPKEKFEAVYSKSSEIGGEIGAVRDLSIACQNLVLRAVDLGLGTCYVGLVNRDKAKEILKIPKDFVLPFIITLGYPNEKPKEATRKPLSKFIIKK